MNSFVTLVNTGRIGLFARRMALIGYYFNPWAMLAGLRTKRTPCFCLCGVYDYDDNTAFAIGSIKLIEIKSTGVISFFVNDAKGYYKNNSGSIKLNVTRLQ